MTEPADSDSRDDWPAGRTLVVAATYNEAENVAGLVDRVLAAAPDLQMLVVDDDSPDEVALEIGNFILGGGALSSRLGDRIRQKEGLSYGVTSSVSVPSRGDDARFTINAITNPANIDAVETAALEELKRFLQSGPSEQELSDAKTAWLEARKTGRSSDGSIAGYDPTVAVVSNISLDHKSMEELRDLFGGFAMRAAHVVANAGDAETAALLADIPNLTTFAVEGAADLVAEALKPEPFAISFDLITGGAGYHVRLSVPGRHNVSNALAAIGASVAAGVPLIDAIRAVERFTGLKRRFEKVGMGGGVTVIDDFGHNPDKIAATLDTLHAFPGRLLILFQPHGYGPLKVMRTELVDSIAARVTPEDVLVLPDPAYFGGTVAREVTSADIVADLRVRGVDARHIADRAEAPGYIDATQQAPVKTVKAAHAAQIPAAPDDDEDDAGDQSPQVVPFEDEGGPL
jgi:hypothetical protein